MSLINGFLEKTSTVEGAITTGAQLQVLGGSYAVGSDPLSMLYESLSDAEGLFDRAVGMAREKVFYDEEKGQFDMAANERYIMKQAATAMGIDPNKLLEVAFRDASLSRIEGQARMNSNIAGDEDMMGLIKNLATWDKGRAVVNIDGKDVDVKDITKEDKEKLEAMQRTDSQNLQEMAISLRSMNEVISGTEKEINNEQAKTTHGISQNITDMLKNNTEMLDILAKIGAWANILGGVGGILAGVWSTSVGVWRMGKGLGNIVGNGSPMGGRGGLGPSGGAGGVGAAAPVKSGVLRNGFTRADFKGGFRETTFTAKNGNVFRDLGGGRLQNVNTGRVIGGRAASNVMATGVKGSGWTNLAKAAGKGLKAGGATALIGGAISLGTDIATGEFKKDKGASIGRAAGTTAGALLGGVLGGPVGAAIGGWLGSVVTEGIQKAQKENRAKIRSKIAADLASSMPQLSKLFEGDDAIQGNYSKSQLNELKNALSDNTISEGELSVNLVDKLRANKDLERMLDQGVNVQIGLAEGGDIIKNNGYATAIPTSSQSKGYLDASNTIIGQSHASGGVHVQDSNINVQGGEKVMTREAVKKYGIILNAMNDGTNFKIIPIEPMGKISKVSPKHDSQGASMPHNAKIEIPPVSVNLTGTIKLDLGNNKQVDISDTLINSPLFIRKITEMISKQINITENGAYRKNKFRQKFV